MTVKDIVKKYLLDNGFDGLAGDECGCEVDDLFPCDSGHGCEPGVKVKCQPDNCPADGDCEWHMATPEAIKEHGMERIN